MASATRRYDIEQSLENDIAELAQLQESLRKTNILTENMGNMLTSFEDRLAKLESSILPIHKSTKHLTRLHENIEKSLDRVDEIVDYLGLAARMDIFISQGPAKSSDINEYLSAVSKIKDALSHLQSLEYKSGDSAIQKLKLVLTKAHFHIETLFRKKLAAQSVPLDLTALINSAGGNNCSSVSELAASTPLPKINDSDLEELVQLTGQLAPLDKIIGEHGSGGDVYEHLKTFAEVRTSYLSKSLYGIAQMSVNSSKGAITTTAGVVGLPPSPLFANYVKGSSPFISYMHYYLRLCKAEKALIQRLIIKPLVQTCYHQTVSAATETFIETAESIITRTKRSLLKKEYMDLYLLIDIASNLADCLKQYDTIVAVTLTIIYLLFD
ncbi:Exocyst complex component 7 [Physocladia obscura]|uniref:Exocyst complex component 7 n=1 Tax=Physocladia obscura TaxID=109957 RepID=A0AAD5SSM7_9FUNG|nr:Exocyst complex component 7 [Physocladia obscura]